MKNMLLLFYMSLPFMAGAQANTDSIPIPLKNGLIVYEKVYAVNNNTSKTELFNKAMQWLQTSYPEFKDNIQADKNTGVITGRGIFKVVVSESGNYYWLRPVITIKVNDGFYSYQAYSFYEKPIEKGITNDWSKIEYRWRDFRKGKPWSPEDYTLFKGLNENALAMMDALEKEMNK
jgi:hypothetical protein